MCVCVCVWMLSSASVGFSFLLLFVSFSPLCRWRRLESSPGIRRSELPSAVKTARKTGRLETGVRRLGGSRARGLGGRGS